MLRSLLALLLLANYLLVVGAGLAVRRPEAPAFSAARPYVHSRHCQQQNYLRLDCFEQCNGAQHVANVKLPTGTGLHYLAQLKALDVHCELAGQVSCVRPCAAPVAAENVPAGPVAEAAGFGGCHSPPPRRA
ncbi:hypothetical protein [Hymenobacter armeniacus]|uniref:Uncharacterized protein n=1 Tax=Hymenobacter armeniacus TaxID=2771358 RepID=A0ABR8JZ55_9BACT|nr:hypothetical protein [Hymenobacter armeniacus]MBD2723284.1 hypothetical protein [Hymenobacter armeniacus]